MVLAKSQPVGLASGLETQDSCLIVLMQEVLWKSVLFFSLSVDWIKPIRIIEGNLLYLKSTDCMPVPACFDCYGLVV